MAERAASVPGAPQEDGVPQEAGAEVPREAVAPQEAGVTQEAGAEVPREAPAMAERAASVLGAPQEDGVPQEAGAEVQREAVAPQEAGVTQEAGAEVPREAGAPQQAGVTPEAAVPQEAVVPETEERPDEPALQPLAMSPGARAAAWAESGGARTSEKVLWLQPTPTGDRRCLCGAKINAGELLLEVPRALVLESPPSRPIGVPDGLLSILSHVAMSEDSSRPTGTSLAVALLLHHERMKGDASEFAPYIDTLPTTFPTMPLLDDVPPWEGGRPEEFYEGTGVQRLARTGANPALSSRRGVAAMRHVVEVFDPDGLFWHHAQRGRGDDVSMLRWAAAAVQSRAHSSRGGRGTALVPLADAFNHSPTSPNVELSEGETCFQVHAIRDVSPGEELFLRYGPFSNAELLFNAGFTCPSNPADCVLVSCKELAEVAHRMRGVAAAGSGGGSASSAAVAEAEVERLEKRCRAVFAGLPAPRLGASAPLFGGAVPTEVVTAIAALLHDDEEWARVLAEAGPHCAVDRWGDDGDLVGKALRTVLLESWTASTEAAGQLRSRVLGVLSELVDRTLRPRYRGPSLEEAASQCAAEEDKEVRLHEAHRFSPPSGRPDADEVRRQRDLNILRIHVGERKVIERLSAMVKARLGALSGAEVGDRQSEEAQDSAAKRPRHTESA